MTQTFVDLDVRPILRGGGEPFEKIMKTVEALKPNQGLRLYATFKPIPLFQVLGAKCSRSTPELDGGDWEVLAPAFDGSGTGGTSPAKRAARDPSAEPVQQADNRELDPPEPMVRILAATEELESGQSYPPCCAASDLSVSGTRKAGAPSGAAISSLDGTTYKIFVRVMASGPTPPKPDGLHCAL